MDSKIFVMAPMKGMKAMKAMKSAQSLTKTVLAEAVAGSTDLKRSDCVKVFSALADVVAIEIKKTGKVTIPGVAMLKTRTKPATKAGKREMFGKIVLVKAKPAKKVVKAFPVAAIKKAI